MPFFHLPNGLFSVAGKSKVSLQEACSVFGRDTHEFRVLNNYDLSLNPLKTLPPVSFGKTTYVFPWANRAVRSLLLSTYADMGVHPACKEERFGSYPALTVRHIYRARFLFREGIGDMDEFLHARIQEVLSQTSFISVAGEPVPKFDFSLDTDLLSFSFLEGEPSLLQITWSMNISLSRGWRTTCSLQPIIYKGTFPASIYNEMIPQRPFCNARIWRAGR